LRGEVETDIERKACKQAEKLGVRNIKINTRSDTGWPDRIFFIPGGRPLFIEFKRPGEDPDPKQEYIHEILKKLGYDIEVHDTVEGAVSAVVTALEASSRAKKRDEVSSRTRVRNSGGRPRRGED
jgi:hypothetical protein